jgi:hypothetical protein
MVIILGERRRIVKIGKGEKGGQGKNKSSGTKKENQ